MIRFAILVAFLYISGSLFSPAAVALSENAITGIASVIDGDTVEVHGTRIRLHGIDAPESNQLCFDVNDQPWRCGQKASLALADRIGRAPISCLSKDLDHYGRVIGVCSQAGEDLNRWMVSQGWAVAYQHYSADYLDSERVAMAAGTGIWSSRFVMPWDWRRGQRETMILSSQREVSDCNIKGNINSRGERIYHLPSGRWYSKTRINESKGERWFCSESEAREAGWRRARQ